MARNRVSVAVIGEGITEKYFIQSLRDVVAIKPMPVKQKNSSLKELEIAIKECVRKGYDRIYCMIDMDNKVPDGSLDHEKNAKEYAKIKRTYHKKQIKCCDGGQTIVQMIESFPSTEIFFLYYFGYTSGLFTNQQLKSLLNKKFGYLTEEKYLIKHSLHDTLIKSGGSLDTAILASQKSKSTSPPDYSGKPYTEIGIMILELQPKNIVI